jgi:predicted dehydrogenase
MRIPDTPTARPPVYIIGAGGIVNDAHLPAYQKAGFTVAGIYDVQEDKARQTAARFSIPQVFPALEQLVEAAGLEAVYDVAVPGAFLNSILQQLPPGAHVLMQKPMGETLQQAYAILETCRTRKLVAGVNFQLRYAPYVQAARELIASGQLGEPCDVEVNVNVYTPWHLWDFLKAIPRMEILYHSIHYIDLLRSLFGNPNSVKAFSTRHPLQPALTSVKSDILLDYGKWLRANIRTNHTHLFGPENQHAYIKIEGTQGAVKMRLGVLMNYPAGVPDRLEYVLLQEGKTPEWQVMPVEGSWFPDAFAGSMEQLMLAYSGAIPQLDNSVEDCIHTMRCVEACYLSDEQPGVRPGEL